MGHMKNAPLIYTMGMIQFPRVPNIERFVDKFLESIRSEYPLDDQSITQTFNANISSDGIKMEAPQATKLWQFASIDRKWGIILCDQGFFIHTANYYDFSSFAERFKAGVIALKTISDIDISWVTSVGIRYVNLIAPKEKASLQDYLQPWVLPGIPPDASLEEIQGICAVRYNTKYGELRLQTLHNPTFTLPPELNSPFVMKNNWIKNKPATEFAVIDIDHGTSWQNAAPFDENHVLETLGNLRKTSRAVFDSVGTEKAKKVWEK
jgi:uncharacterized protein (TIGR04255 family)